MADYRLNRQIEAQSRAFVAGVHSVVPLSWLRLFTTPELQRLINGDDAPIDVNDLRRHTRYAGGYNELTPTVRDLWRVVADFSHEDRALLLKFVTSCSKPPLLGFKYLQPPFTVQCVSGDGGETPSVLAFFGMGRNERRGCRPRAPASTCSSCQTSSRGRCCASGSSTPSGPPRALSFREMLSTILVFV